jgi:hypothetical protein
MWIPSDPREQSTRFSTIGLRYADSGQYFPFPVSGQMFPSHPSATSYTVYCVLWNVYHGFSSVVRSISSDPGVLVPGQHEYDLFFCSFRNNLASPLATGLGRADIPIAGFFSTWSLSLADSSRAPLHEKGGTSTLASDGPRLPFMTYPAPRLWLVQLFRRYGVLDLMV